MFVVDEDSETVAHVASSLHPGDQFSSHLRRAHSSTLETTLIWDDIQYFVRIANVVFMALGGAMALVN